MRIRPTIEISGESYNTICLSRLIALFRASSLRTDVAAAVASPTDISTASWLPTNATCTATVLTDTSDGAPATHRVASAAAVPGMQIEHPYIATFDFNTAASNKWAYCGFGVTGTNGCRAYFNPATGATGTLANCTAAVSAIAGGYRLTLTTGTGITGTPTAMVYTASGDGGVTYQGDGTGTLGVTNITVYQTQVSALGSVAGSAGAVSLAQATAANRPQVLWTNGTLYSPVPVAGYRPVLYGDGVSDCLAAAFAGLTQPYTVLARANLTALVTTRPVVSDVSDLDGGIYFRPASAAMAIYAGTALQSAYSPTGNVSLAGVFNGAASSVWANGVQSGSTGNAGTNGASGISLFGTATQGHMVGYIDEIAIVAGALSPGDIMRAHSFCQSQYP